MSSSVHFERPRDRYSNDEAGQRIRCKDYALAARAALQKPHVYFPLMMVRRDSKAQQDLDFDATLLLEIARQEQLIPSLSRSNIEATLERLPSVLRTLSDDEPLIATAITLLRRMVWVDARLNLDGDMSDEDIMQIVEEFHVVSACVEAGVGQAFADPEAEHDGDVEELVLSDLTTAKIAQTCAMSTDAVDAAIERLYPWHTLCCPVLGVLHEHSDPNGIDPLHATATERDSSEPPALEDDHERFFDEMDVAGSKPPTIH
jgi:hypothetical protein